MEFQTNYRLENYLLQTQWEDLPEQVQQRARVCSVDLMMALILGSNGKQFQNGTRLAKAVATGELSIPGCADSFGMLGAAIAMGHASNSFDIDDGHNMIKGHPGTSFVGGVMAAALEKGVSYREYLTTLIVCYDVAVRMGLAMQDHYQFLHSTGAYGAVATAAGVGRILGFDRAQMNTAISMAEFHAPMTPVMRAVEHPSMNKDGTPFGVMVGMLAALDTLAGETAKTHLLELPSYQPMLDSLGKEYEVMNLYFKPFTCCRWAHQPIQAGLTLMKEHKIEARQIKAVTVHTFDSAAKLSKIVPKDTDEAQYNIAYPVAAALVHGDLGFLQVCDEALGNPDVIEMMGRLSFVVDPALDAQFPVKRLAWVEMLLHDGRTLKSTIFAAPGEAGDGVDFAWISQKFRRITKPFLEPEAQEALLDRLLYGELDGSMRALVAEVNRLLRQNGVLDHH